MPCNTSFLGHFARRYRQWWSSDPMTSSDLTLMEVRSRSGQIRSKIFNQHFLVVLRPNAWLIFHIDMFIVPLYTIRCQSGPLTQFTLRRFWRRVWRCSLPGRCASQTFRQETVTTLCCFALNGEHVGKDFRLLLFTVFEIYACKVEKLSILLKFDLWHPIAGSNIDLV